MSSDFSGNGHTGILHGATTWPPSTIAVGMPGKYATFTTSFSTTGTHRITAVYSVNVEGITTLTTSPVLDMTVRNADFRFDVLLHVYYVDPMGLGGTPSDLNSGTSITEPLATYNAACGKAEAGDTIVLRGGQYDMLDPTQGGSLANLNLASASGEAGAPITYTNYPGETPTLDFSEQEPESSAQNPAIKDVVVDREVLHVGRESGADGGTIRTAAHLDVVICEPEAIDIAEGHYRSTSVGGDDHVVREAKAASLDVHRGIEPSGINDVVVERDIIRVVIQDMHGVSREGAADEIVFWRVRYCPER